MREVKSVKVDNWGVFFLQKLQNFFNKTDYCDLTLQFNDNSQLKVHRLVLSACTDYFNVLEQTCEVIDDILIMPHGLQADVIVPIVNFMYTGTLEFEIEMYGRLLKTARDMNMTVLLKLLEAHKRTVDTSRAQQLRRIPKSFPSRRPAPAQQIRVDRTYTTQSTTSYNEQPRTVPVSAHQLRTLQIKPVAASTSYYTPGVAEPSSLVAKYAHNKTPMKGPSRFECNDETTLPPDSFEQFDSISYESKPLITANQACKDDIEDYDNLIPAHDTSSTFEQLRKGYTGNKRPTSSISSFESPPEKKPNIQDVKEYAEQQRMRKQITAEYEDDNEYDEVVDDEFHNDDDDEDYVPPAHLQKTMRKPGPSAVVIKQEKDQKPTIVVKDTVGSNVNHAKIISEVLKKYPHLVKNNKNIKLKIMAKSTSPNQPQSIIIKQEPEPERPTSIQTQTQQRPIVKTVTTQPAPPPPPPKQQIIQPPRPVPIKTPVAVQTITQRPPQQVIHPPTTQNVATSTTIQTQKVPVTTNPAPRRIDSKTMHALIALGAENTTGPWLCLRCGVNGRPISIPSYRGFRRHLINTHKEKVDPRLCEHCGWRSGNDNELYHHIKVQHSIAPPPGYDFPQCPYCPSICLNKVGLDQHLKDDHPEKVIYQQHCMYCDSLFKDEDELFNHMNAQHKAQAQKDGLIDYSDEEETYYSGDQGVDKGIKILSNITISPQAPIESATNKLGTESLSTVATGIAASLGLIDSSDSQEIQYLEESAFISVRTGKTVQEPKFVNADGQIMDLTPEQRDEIISQLEGQPEGGVVMVLNDSFPSGAGEIGDAEVKLESEDSTSLHCGFVEEKEVEAKVNESAERMDWQSEYQSSIDQAARKAKENVIDAEQPEEDPLKQDENINPHDESMEDDEDQAASKQAEQEDEKEKLEKAKEKLKLLAGDWSDDEEEVNDESANNTKETIETPDTSKEIEPKDKTLESENEEVIYETTTAKKLDENPAIEIPVATTDEKVSEVTEKCLDESIDKDEPAQEYTTPDISLTEVEKTATAEAEEDKEDDLDSTTKTNQKDKSDSGSEKIEPNTDLTDNTEIDKGNSPKVETEKMSAADEKKDGNGGDPIRTLISEWGDDDEEL